MASSTTWSAGAGDAGPKKEGVEGELRRGRCEGGGVCAGGVDRVCAVWRAARLGVLVTPRALVTLGLGGSVKEEL